MLRNESAYTSTHIIKPGLRAVVVGDLSERNQASMHRAKTEAGQQLTCEYHLAELLQDPESCPPKDYMIYLYSCYASYCFRLTVAYPMAPFPMLVLSGQFSMTTPERPMMLAKPGPHSLFPSDAGNWKCSSVNEHHIRGVQ